MCQIISNSKEKEKDFEKLLEYLLNAVKEKIKEYAEDPNFNRLMLIQNYIIFFMCDFNRHNSFNVTFCND